MISEAFREFLRETNYIDADPLELFVRLTSFHDSNADVEIKKLIAENWYDYSPKTWTDILVWLTREEVADLEVFNIIKNHPHLHEANSDGLITYRLSTLMPLTVDDIKTLADNPNSYLMGTSFEGINLTQDAYDYFITIADAEGLGNMVYNQLTTLKYFEVFLSSSLSTSTRFLRKFYKDIEITYVYQYLIRFTNADSDASEKRQSQSLVKIFFVDRKQELISFIKKANNFDETLNDDWVLRSLGLREDFSKAL